MGANLTKLKNPVEQVQMLDKLATAGGSLTEASAVSCFTYPRGPPNLNTAALSSIGGLVLLGATSAAAMPILEHECAGNSCPPNHAATFICCALHRPTLAFPSPLVCSL